MGRGRKSKAGIKVEARKKITVKLINREHAGEVVEVYRIMERLKADRNDLFEAKIACAWRYGKKADADGRLWLGQCKKGSDLDRSLHGYDFVILLNYEAWQSLDVKQREALMFHELTHAAVSKDANGEAKTDEEGRVVYRIRKHDLEEFREVANRYGCWKDDIREFVTTAINSKAEKGKHPLFDAAESNGKHAKGNGAASNGSGSNGNAPAGDWRKVAIDVLFTGRAREVLEENKLKTLGKLVDYTNSGKRLEDLAGCGTATKTQIADRLAQWWRDNPQHQDDPAACVPVKS